MDQNPRFDSARRCPVQPWLPAGVDNFTGLAVPALPPSAEAVGRRAEEFDAPFRGQPAIARSAGLAEPAWLESITARFAQARGGAAHETPLP